MRLTLVTGAVCVGSFHMTRGTSLRRAGGGQGTPEAHTSRLGILLFLVGRHLLTRISGCPLADTLAVGTGPPSTPGATTPGELQGGGAAAGKRSGVAESARRARR